LWDQTLVDGSVLIEICNNYRQVELGNCLDLIEQERLTVAGLRLARTGAERDDLFRIIESFAEASSDGLRLAGVPGRCKVVGIEELEVDVLIFTPCLHEAVVADVLAGERDVGLVPVAHDAPSEGGRLNVGENTTPVRTSRSALLVTSKVDR